MNIPFKKVTGPTLSRRQFVNATAATVALTSTAGAWSALKQEIHDLSQAGWEKHPVACQVCGATCGLLMMKRPGYPVGPDTIRIYPNPDHPQRGYCARGAQAFYPWNSPLRLKKPLKRVGEKGEGRFKEISWDEALDEIAAKVKEICDKDGEHSVVMTSHNYSNYQKWLSSPLGTPNQIPHSGSCNASSTAGKRWVFGPGFDNQEKIDPDYEHAKLLLCIGRSMNCSMGAQHVISQAVKNGDLKVIYVDPRMPQASFSNAQWIPIRPATDAALVLGLINYGIEHKLVDSDWLMKHSNAGYLVKTETTKPLTQADLVPDGSKKMYAVIDAETEQVKFQGMEKDEDGKFVRFIEDGKPLALEFVGKIQVNDGTAIPVKTAFTILKETASKYSPETVEEITGIGREDFVTLAKDFYRLKGVVDDGWYSARNGNDSTAFALISILNVLNGTFDQKGGLVVTQGGGFGGVPCGNSGTKGNGPHGEKWTLPDGKRLDLVYYPEGSGTISAVYNAIEIGDPYPVRALFITGTTMFHREAHTQSMIDALKATELVVVQDIFPPEIVDYADYVLPTTYFLEKEDYAGVKWNRDGWVQKSDGVLDPPPGNESRDERWQFCEILRRAYPERAKERLGYDHEIKDGKEFKVWWRQLLNDQWHKFIQKKNEAKPGDGDRINHEVAENGYALSAVKKYGNTPYKVPFGTPTGKAELVSFYLAEKYEKPLINPIHDYHQSIAWTYPKPNSYEFFLISGKDASASSGTTLFTQPAEFLGDRRIWMNSQDAKRLNLMDGDTVRITSLDTKVAGEAKLRVTNRVIPGTLYSNAFQGDVRTKHLCAVKGFDWIREGLNTNRLCTAYKEPLVGSSSNNVTVMVELARRRMA